MKKWLLVAVVLGVVAVGVSFILRSLRESAAPPAVAQPPSLPATPAFVYGLVEPRGREVFVGAPEARRVIEVGVHESDRIQRGQMLCVLEHDVEREEIRVARARIAEAQAQLALAEEVLRRNTDLFARGVLPESEFRDSRLEVEYDRERGRVTEAEAVLAQARLDRLTLKSPIDGMVYKFDVRLGETLAAGDNTRIVLGAPERQVRLFIEVFWMQRVRPEDRTVVRDAETGERIGVGTVVEVAPYLGRRDFRTEDSQERFDTKYQQVILALDTEDRPAPQLGLSVVAELAPQAAPRAPAGGAAAAPALQPK